MTVTEKACAKLNLTLWVGEKREDGYHRLRSVMTSLSLCDTVTITAHTGGADRLLCDTAITAQQEDNLCMKALRVFFARTGQSSDGVEIALTKRIPMQAGLGGGSSDAAAVLRALRRCYAPGLTDEALEEMAAQVGSDVPFCVAGHTALATGRGEQLAPLPSMPPCCFVLVKPREGYSTGEMYRRLDDFPAVRKDGCEAMIEALRAGDAAAVAAALRNDFELVLPEGSATAAIKAALLRCGAAGAVLCGSGSTVAGLFLDEETAQEALAQLDGGGDWEVFFAQPV